MLRTALWVTALGCSLAGLSPARAGPAEDAAAALAATLDKFNGGDVDAFVAAHQDGAIIVDEFAPYLWGGPGSAQRWIGDYVTFTQGTGDSGGRIDHGKPIQAVSDGNSAYVVLPATYRFTRKGTKMAGKGSMTFVMRRAGNDWKIGSWTYSGATPVPED